MHLEKLARDRHQPSVITILPSLTGQNIELRFTRGAVHQIFDSGRPLKLFLEDPVFALRLNGLVVIVEGNSFGNLSLIVMLLQNVVESTSEDKGEDEASCRYDCR